MPLSSFLQKLLFVRQFSINKGKIEVLGNRYIMLDASDLLVLQDIDKTKMYERAKEISKKNLKSLVEHAQVYKNIKTQSLKNIANLSKKIGKSDEGVIKTLQQIFEIYGLGKLNLLDLNNKDKKVILNIPNSALSDACLQNKKSKTPVCTLTAGILAGIFSYIFDKDVDCIETKCRACGAETCDFKIS